MKRKMIPLLTLLLVAVMCITLASCGNPQKHLEYSRNSDGTYEITGITKDVRKIHLPETHNGAAVTSIGYKAFILCGMKQITIPDSITSIGQYAFQGCENLTSITIGNGVTSIGDHAFNGCESLTSITIPDSVTHIGEWAFWRCESLTSITIPDGVTRIDEWTFSDCSSLTSITIPDSVTSIGERAFADCGNLSAVYYTGTEEEWNRVWISSGNNELIYATIYYRSEP